MSEKQEMAVDPVERTGPPCCKVACLRSCGEENRVCGGCGKVGCLSSQTRFRRPLFTLTMVASIAALLLQIIICFGTAKSNGLIKAFSWARGTITKGEDDISIYVGANRYVLDLEGLNASSVYELTNGTTNESAIYGIDWDDDIACDGRSVTASSYCKECKDASTGQIMSTYMGLISGLGQISTDWTRRRYRSDINCQKFLGIFTGILGVFMNLIAVSSFRADCVENVNDNMDDLDGAMTLGPGMICLIVSTIIKAFDTVVHIVIPTPAARHERTGNQTTSMTEMA